MLYIFDLDGTLVETYGTQPLSGVVERLAALHAGGHKLAVATNQAGVAWRARTGKPTYPSGSTLGTRFGEIAARLSPLQTAPWFVAIYDERARLPEAVYAELVQEFLIAAPDLDLRVSADPEWRKPGPGMLKAACQAFEVRTAGAIYVGDMDSDAAAAAAAAMPFIRAADFLSRHTLEVEQHL